MDQDEKIHTHIVSIWREATKFFSMGGREGMLLLTDRHLCFIHKTTAKRRWWTSVRSRQVLKLTKSPNTMIRYDGYGETELLADLKNPKNVELAFDDILEVGHRRESWGTVLNLKYAKNGKVEKFQYSVAKDWVKYPASEPTKFMTVDWAPFVAFIKERQRIKE